MRFIYKHEAYWPILQSIRRSGGATRGEKDAVLSKQLREAGNSSFSSREDETAMKCYNEALLAAPADPWDGQGEDMALAFANRSALFFRWRPSHFSLQSINSSSLDKRTTPRL